MPANESTGRVFISYRRADSAYPAQSIRDALASHFGKDSIFFDVDSIPIGTDFHEYLNDAVAKSDLLLVVIGDRWVDARDEAGKRRLEDPDDFVRIEIEAALKQQIPVVPVLVGEAKVPRPQQLPDCLAELTKSQATAVRPGRSLPGDLDILVQDVVRAIAAVPMEAASPAVAEAARLSVQITDSISMKLALIPAGEFLMGSPETEPGRSVNEFQHRVRITEPFYLGVYPVTQEEYEALMGENPSHFEGDERLPVERVCWLDAVKFCNRLSERTDRSPYYRFVDEFVRVRGGEGYRLPTEAEWEYACRAGTSAPWYCGNDENGVGDVAWHDANSNGRAHPVGEKGPNAWGLFDMHGNVWEWCEDWYGNYSDAEVTDPRGPSETTDRVFRGGSWGFQAEYCRSASRRRNLPEYRRNSLGFRVARSTARRAESRSSRQVAEPGA